MALKNSCQTWSTNARFLLYLVLDT
uniref:Uncharacterized protein n=1 Tax=Vitis vinifera TaxID=29760 RepID=F6HJM1_VITVI